MELRRELGRETSRGPSLQDNLVSLRRLPDSFGPCKVIARERNGVSHIAWWCQNVCGAHDICKCILSLKPPSHVHSGGQEPRNAPLHFTDNESRAQRDETWFCQSQGGDQESPTFSLRRLLDSKLFFLPFFFFWSVFQPISSVCLPISMFDYVSVHRPVPRSLVSPKPLF